MTEESLKALKQLRQDYLQTFDTEAGQKVLGDLKKRFFWNHTTFAPGEGETQLNEGGRRVLLTIENIMTLPIEELIKEEESNENG